MTGPTCRRAGTAAAVVMTACGAGATAPARCPAPAVSVLHAQTGPVGVDADKPRVAAGSTVTFTVTASGPAQYQADCAGPVQLLVSDSTDIRVDAARSAQPLPSSCGTVQLAPGHRAVYSIAWHPDSTLPPGQYVATLMLGDQPAVAVTLALTGPQEPQPCGTGA